MDVPARLRLLVGKTSWKHSLGTADPRFAALKRAELIAHYKAEIIRLDGELAQGASRKAEDLIDEAFEIIATRKGSVDVAVRILLSLICARVFNAWGEEERVRAMLDTGNLTIDEEDAMLALEAPEIAGFSDDERSTIFLAHQEFEGTGFSDGLVKQQVVRRMLTRRQWDAVYPELLLLLHYVGSEPIPGTPSYDVAAEHLLSRLANHQFSSWLPGAREALSFVTEASALSSEAVSATVENRPSLQGNAAKALSDGLLAWQRLAQPRPQSINEAERAVGRFINMFGDLPVGSIIRDQILEYRDLIGSMPANLNFAKITSEGRSLRDVIATAQAGNVEYKTLAPASIKKDIGALQAILGALANEAWIPGNVAAGIRIQGYSKTRKGQKNPRLPFKPGMMQALFDSPLFTGCAGESDAARAKPGSKVFQDELYWAFLFAATAGPRVEEIGQMQLADIEEIDMQRAYAEGHSGTCTAIYLTGTGEGQSLKNDSSERVIVIHPCLIDLGFTDYVRSRRESGASRLFNLTADANGKWTKELSRRLNRYIDRTVTEDPRFTFHSLRHEWKDRAEDSDIHEKMSDQMTGHAPSTVGRRYGVGASVRKQFDEIQKLNLNFIDWQRLKKAAGRV